MNSTVTPHGLTALLLSALLLASAPPQALAKSTQQGLRFPAYQDDAAGEQPSAEPGADAASNRDATTFGAPSYDITSYREVGMASWYGKPFQGKRTSGGDPYDMYAMTAAHPTLPIPSYIHVTNLANGRSAVVRVNDRGPFHPGRILDLSYAAAYKLGFSDSGQAKVEVSLVLPEEVSFVASKPVPPLRHARHALAVARPTPAPAPAEAQVAAEITPPEPPAPRARPVASVSPSAEKPAGEVFLQLGAFATLLGAEQFKSFAEHELRIFSASVSVLSAGGKHRLNIGPFTSAQDARAMAERIATTLKIKPYVVQR